MSVIEDELGMNVPVAGMAKNDKHNTSELIMGDPPVVVPLKRNSSSFYLLQRIQDEVHRFAITFHRQTRGKTMFSSVLDDIPGVGEKRKRALLKHFGSMKNMKAATVDDFRAIAIPDSVSRELLKRLHEAPEPK